MDTTANGSWEPGPATVRASAGVVDIWRADLDGAGDAEDQLEETLSPDELARAGQILAAHERRLWVRARGVLRTLLGRYLGSDPREARFELGPEGKPALLRGTARPAARLSFNLSHSGSLALFAFTAGRAVGVDVEMAGDRRRDELAVASRVFGESRARQLAELDPQVRSREFLRAWVAHEAAVKCRGAGLFTLRADSLEDDLWSAELDVGPRAAAAVAVAVADGSDGSCELRLWEWGG